MNFTFEKLDSSCFNILPLSWNECPKETLSTIGINFSALDAEVCNLSFSAENFWNPLYSDFVSNSANWNSVFTTVRDNSSCWQSTYITVRELSASWLSPMTIIYPSVFAQDVNGQSVIEDWIKTNFPISQGNCVNYLNGQLMKVFSLEYATENQQFSCSCRSNGGRVNVRFIGIGTIPVNCGCSCSPGSVNCPDKFVKKVLGFQFVVANGEWVYNGDVY